VQTPLQHQKPRGLSSIRVIKIGSLGAAAVGVEKRAELDSHADTCAVSENLDLILNDYDQPVLVHNYEKTVGRIECKTVDAVVAYDHQGEVYYLFIKQALLIPNVESILLSPMQLRDNGIRVNDEPKFMVPTPKQYHHSIAIPPNGSREEELVIPLSLAGVTSYFPV
jgi:hypothetical protein